MNDFDITCQIGALYYIDTPEKPAEWPMYSFDRPARMLWNAIGKRLTEKGWSENRVKEWLQSKSTRWALDGTLGDAIEALGRSYADKVDGGTQS